MAPGHLQEVLEALKPMGRAQPDLLVGLGAADDAAVYRISADVAIVATVDFFPPVVDDPWTWGAISATNSMSDVFAMGGEVLFALAVAGFPREMSKAIIAEGFRGGSDKIAEAGHWSGGMKRNRRHVDAVFGEGLRIDPSVPAPLVALLTESETSGGLLFSVAAGRAPGVLDAFRRRGEECWEIGEVLSEPV